MSSTPTDLRLLQVERAAGMGFNISNRTGRGNKTTLAVFEQILTAEFLNWGQYMSIQIMGAAAEAINHTIVIWVAHPQDKTALIVHHLHSIQGSGLAIHAPMHAKGVIHLRFLNSANELDSDVFIWGAGNAGHFELLCERVNGWPKGKADTFTPPCGPGMNEGAASGAATVAGADAVGGDAANNPVGVAAGTDASGGDAAAIAARAKQAKRAEAAKAARKRKRDADLASNEAAKKALLDFRQTILDKLLDDAAPSTKDKPGAGRPPPPNAGKSAGSMWDKLAAAKAADPRVFPYAKGPKPTEEKYDYKPGPDRYVAKPCPPRPNDCRVEDGHPYSGWTVTNNSMPRGAFLTETPCFTLRDLERRLDTEWR